MKKIKFEDLKPIEVISENMMKVEGLTCPTCKALIDGATPTGLDVEIRVPHVGDLGVCAFCGQFFAYAQVGDRLIAVVGTDADFRKLPVDGQEQVRGAVAFFKKAAEYRKAHPNEKMLMKMKGSKQ